MLLQAIRKSVLGSLVVLDISQNKIEKGSAQELSYFVEDSKCIQEISLADCSLTQEMVVMILQPFSTNLNLVEPRIDLSHNKLEPECAIPIRDCLQNSTTLHTIRLQHNDFKRPGMELLISAVEKSPSLKCVDLSCNLASPCIEVMKLIGELITKNKKLETLILAGNEKFRIGKDMRIVFPTLAESTVGAAMLPILTQLQLTSLDISGNAIGDKSIIELAEILRKNTSLTELFLDQNSVHLGGLQSLASLMKVNKNIVVLPAPSDDIQKAVDGKIC